jgi:hypothetical protein
VPAEPEWIASAVADINYTGPVPGTQAFWTAGTEEDLDDGGGGSDGKSGDDDPDGGNDGSEVGGGGEGNDGSEGEDEVPTCNWGHLEILQLRVEFAQSNYVEHGIGDREDAEAALARVRTNGFIGIAGAAGVGALGGPLAALGSALVASVTASKLEQDAMDDLAEARLEEERFKGIRDEALSERIQYYNERKCSEIAPDQAFAPEGWLRTSVRLEVQFARRLTMGVHGRWMRTSS